MNDHIEELVLSGRLFANHSRSSSPERTPSPDPGWHDEELKHRRISPHFSPGKSDGEDGDYNSDTVRRREFEARLHNEKESIGMGPGRTGVKGVIRDRSEAMSRERERQRRDIEELNRKMEKSNLGGKSYLEEEREKANDPGYEGKVDKLVLKEMRALKGERRDMFGRRKESRFGHLREVGLEAFVASVEEQRGVWVIVHLYDQSLDRCEDLDDTLAHLARLHPSTKFLRARASALGFASSSKPLNPKKQVYRRRYSNRIANEYDERDKYSEDDDDSEEEGDVDLDMLPTLLVYRDGQLVHNWVRVDWEAGITGVESLLERNQILSRKSSLDENLEFPLDGLDDEDDDNLQWSDTAEA
ncbi:hypothetical protein AX15_001091 [Amanita polypyramis BW_CC]|nr:hypothetical protein AX15_001091 [Amanita polypyramis BW_CC]